MMLSSQAAQTAPAPQALSTKLWVYTNYDCNLSCSYCVAESHPKAPRRALESNTVERIVDEAVEMGFESIYFTGGEPFILKDIFAMLAYASAKLPTTVLTNAMVFRPGRLKALSEINNESLIIQVSLDGSRPEHHDPYRGKGSWQKTINGIHSLLDMGFRMRLSTTETPANTQFIDEICQFCRSLGIPEEDHFIRPLAKRGFSQDGMEVSKRNLIPEMTINAQGVFWHPLTTDSDLLVCAEIFPLVEAISKIKAELEDIVRGEHPEMQEFH